MADEKRKDQDKRDTTKAEEWGERVETGRQKACGGKSDCDTPGAEQRKPDDRRPEKDSDGE